MRKPKVILLSHTAEPEHLIALAAKICYSECGIEELKTKIEKKEQKEFLRMLMKAKHLSTFEHASFTFAIEDISRVMTHQLVRHRHASYSQQSQRYVKFGQDLPYRVPDSINDNPKAKELYDNFMDNAAELYQILATEFGIKAEDARYLLPHCVDTKIMVTMNARELVQTYFPERLCYRAQHEHRQVAMEMYKLVLPIAPNIFKNVGPACITDRCHQGKLACGLADVVKAEFCELQQMYQEGEINEQ